MALASVRTTGYHLATDNKRIAHVISSNGAEVAQRMRFGGFNLASQSLPTFTDVRVWVLDFTFQRSSGLQLMVYYT